MKSYWYVLYTEENVEIKVAALLKRKKIKNYCPLNTLADPKNNRKRILTPLFKNFVFVNIESEKLFKLKQLKGIRGVMYWLNKPAQVRNEEIIVIEELLKAFQSLKLEKIPINIYNKIEISSDYYFELNNNMTGSCSRMSKTLLPSLGYALITSFKEGNSKIDKNVIIVNEKIPLL